MRPSGYGRSRGLVSSRVSGQRTESHTYAPEPALADVVFRFWNGSWELRGQAPHVTELISDPCVNFVFESAGKHAGNRLVGVWTKLWRRTLEGKGCVRGVKLRPGAFRAFSQIPAHTFTNRIVALDSIFGPEVSDVERAVLEADTDDEAFAALGVWLGSMRGAHDPSVSLAVELTSLIECKREITSVAQLAQIAGLGVRALERLFHDYVGAPPKWVIQRHRLQEAAVRLERGVATIAALAAELGYADQAHLARDFKRVVGKSPSAFASAVWT
jgi:AraC-like DNA-binding protein